MRRIMLLPLLLSLTLGLVACAPTRSVEAYCAVMTEHKERYLTATDTALAADPLSGAVQLVSAVADLQAMFRQAAEVAPAEIADDVEQVAQYWAAQEEIATQALSNPLAGLAGAFSGAVFNSAALGRVNEYTATNCPSVGRMF